MTAHARPTRLVGASLGAFLLAACGGGGGTTGETDPATGDPGGTTTTTGATGTLTLGVTDMPVDDAVAVNVVFTGVSIKPAGDDIDPITVACDDPGFDCGGSGSRSIDLLALTGDESETLLDGVTVPAGDYEWIRLQVDAAQPKRGSTGASNIVLESNPGGSEVLAIPSGSQTGLKLVSGFSVPQGGSASFTIDFDLRRGIVERGGPITPKYMLKPALRLADNNSVGTIAGTFEPGLYGACDTPENAAVYVYTGGQATTGDIGSDDAPLASMGIVDDDGDGVDEPSDTDGVFAFEFGFLDAEPDYTVAVTCDADADTEDAGDDLEFVDTANDVAVDPRETTTVTFDGPA